MSPSTLIGHARRFLVTKSAAPMTDGRPRRRATIIPGLHKSVAAEISPDAVIQWSVQPASGFRVVRMQRTRGATISQGSMHRTAPSA